MSHVPVQSDIEIKNKSTFKSKPQHNNNANQEKINNNNKKINT